MGRQASRRPAPLARERPGGAGCQAEGQGWLHTKRRHRPERGRRDRGRGSQGGPGPLPAGTAREQVRGSAVRTVIIGAGEVGFNTARMLSHEGHDVVLVEQDEALAERAADLLDALVIHGNGASPKLLAEAGIKKADLLIAASSSDEANIIACLAAKVRGVSRTVARIHNPDYYDPREPLAQDMLGIDFIIHTEQMAAEEIKEALLVPGAINVETFAGNSIEVAEVVLNEGS